MSSAQPWSGFLYDGRTAERQPVAVSLEAEGIRLVYGGGASLWPIADVRQTQGSFSSEMLRLEYGTDPVQVLFVDQPGFGGALLRAFPGVNRTLRGRRQTTRVVGIGIAVMVAVAVLYVVGANPMADWVVRRMPPEWEVQLGRSVVERMAPPERQCTDAAGGAAMRTMLDRLLTAAPPTPYAFRLTVVRDSSINAFAAPGGYVVVHDGLLRAAKSPDEVAGVLAHEVQHVLHRHSTRGIVREAPLRIAVSVLFGGSSVEGLATLAGSLGALSYRRSDESEADRDGMRLLQAAEIDGDAMVSFMQTLARENSRTPRLVSYLSSHPHTDARVSELRGLVQQGSATRPLMDDATWGRVQAMCGP
jgi:predicted Zn-dependent protease